MRLSAMISATCVACLWVGMASAADDTGAMGGMGQQQMQKPDAVVMETAQASFTVKAVDPATRTVTLQTPEGKEIKYAAGENVRRFDQIKVGDIVQASVIRRLGIFVHDPGTAPAKPEQDVIAEATKGPKPGVVVGKTDQMSVDIKSIDQDKRTITVQGPRGKDVTVDVPQQVDISSLKAGDQITARWTEVLAIQTLAPDEARPAGQQMPATPNQ